MKWVFAIAGIGALALVVAFFQYPTEAESESMTAEISYKPSSTIRNNVETYWQIMRAAAYDNVTSDRADDFKEDMAWFAGFVAERSERYGALKSIDEPLYAGPGEATIVVRFKENAYAFNLAIDSAGEIAQISTSNYADQDDLSNLSWSDLGDDTLRVTTIGDLSTLRKAFQNDDGMVRLVSIISPT